MEGMDKYPVLVMGLFGKSVEGSLKKIYFPGKKKETHKEKSAFSCQWTQLFEDMSLEAEAALLLP